MNNSITRSILRDLTLLRSISVISLADEYNDLKIGDFPHQRHFI